MEQDGYARSKEVKRRLIEDGTDLFKRYKIKKVVLFGSVLEKKMTIVSDVDLLVDSLAAEHFFALQCLLEEVLNTWRGNL